MSLKELRQKYGKKHFNKQIVKILFSSRFIFGYGHVKMMIIVVHADHKILDFSSYSKCVQNDFFWNYFKRNPVKNKVKSISNQRSWIEMNSSKKIVKTSHSE